MLDETSESDTALLNECERILQHGKHALESKRFLGALLNRALSSLDVRELLGVWLKADPEAFIKGVLQLNDLSGSIISYAIKSPLDNASDTVLTSICHILKKASLSEIIPLYSLYFSVMAKYPTTSCSSQLSLLISLLNPYTLDKSYIKVKSLFVLICKLSIDADRAGTIASISAYFDLIDQDCSQTEFILFACALESLYSLMPMELEPVYISENTKTLILRHATLASLELANYKDRPIALTLVSSVLRLISACNMTETCRDFNFKHYLDLLVKAFVSPSPHREINSYSSLAIIKIWPLIEAQKKTGSAISVTIEDLLQELVAVLKAQVVIDNDGHAHIETELCKDLLDSSIESLMYLSIQATVKNSIRQDVSLVEIMIALLRSSPLNENISSHIVYGVLLVISNATLLKAASQSDRQNIINGLKDFTDPTTANSKPTKEQEKDIALFNRQLLLDYNIVSVMAELKIIKQDSQVIDRNVALIVKIIFMLSLNQDKEMRQALVAQGGLTLLLSVLMLLTEVVGTKSRPVDSNAITVETRLSGARAMAKILTMVNPQLAFKKYDIRTAVTFLVELLGHDYTTFDEKSGVFGDGANKNIALVTLIDQYELLLALTNLASIESNHELRIQIVNRTFDQHLDYFAIDSDHPELQKACWELISNLVTEPICLAKLFNFENNSCKKRTSLAVKLLNSQDLSLQLVIGGLLANATSEYEFIATSLLEQKSLMDDLIRIIISIYRDQVESSDLLVRITVLLLNLVSAAAAKDTGKFELFKSNQDLKSALVYAIRNNKDSNLGAMMIECVKVIA